jgi:DNA-binding NarL/FixJ family response regulator
MKVATRFSLLTKREIEILRMIAQGYTNLEIAECLTIGENTVSNRVHRMMKKVGLFRRVHLATYALKEKLISLDEIDYRKAVR